MTDVGTQLAPVRRLTGVNRARCRTVWQRFAKLRRHGTLAVTSAIAISGLCSYGFLTVSSRALDVGDYARLAAAWTLVYAIEPALFAPVARVLARELAVGRVAQDRSSLEACVRSAVLLLLTVGVPVLAAVAVLIERIFDGDWLLYAAVVFAIPAQMSLDLAWGFSLGRMRYATYGRLYAVDGAVRFGLACALAALGVRSAAAFALALSAGPVVAVIWNRVWLRPPAGSPPTGRERLMANRSVRHQAFSSTLAVLMLSSSPLIVKSLASSSQRADAGRFLNALTVSQAPLMLAMALLLVLLPILTRLANEGRIAQLRRLTVRLIAGHVVLSLLAVPVAGVAGPVLIRLAYGADYDLPSLDLALLVLASALFLGGQLVAQVLLALRREGYINIAYVAGVLTMATVILTMDGLLRRVEVAFVAGTAAAYCLLLGATCRELLYTRRQMGAHRRVAGLPTPNR